MKNHFTTLQNNQKYLSFYSPVPSVQNLDKAEFAAAPRLRFRGVPYSAKPAHRRVFYDCVKRGLDISVSISIIVAALPLIAAIIALIKLTSPGPVFFRHKRIGKNGAEFDCLKFRTMVADAEKRLETDAGLRREFEEKFKIENDPRITRVGKFLRRTSLDELPQLVQVIEGKMTLIGPRPIVKKEVEKYSIYAEKLFTVTPGLSGLWQTSGRSDTSYAERVRLDMYYIDNRSLRLELFLLLMTVATVAKKSGAY